MLRIPLPLLILGAVLLHAQNDAVAAAIAAMQQGDLHSAEQQLQAELKTRPGNPAALAVLGVVLDQEKKFDEAESAYKRALAIDPSEPTLLNNYGNHLLAAGHVEAARQMFLRTVAVHPSDKNANVQLARLAVDRKRGVEALTYLEHLSRADRDGVDVDLLFGMALSSVRRYGEAEDHFRRVQAAKPDDFDAVYALGLAASKAKHAEQAQQALEHALELQPGNADVLYDLAVVNLQQDKGIEAMALLVRGARIAPERADIQLLLAQSAARLGYFEDSIAAWDKYLSLKPADDAAVRERAFAAAAIGKSPESALQDLAAFTQKHPTDAVGHYELGTALSASEPAQAAEELTRAIKLKPTLSAAYVARGLLSHRQGNNDAALRDFAAAAKQEPHNPRILDRLGEAYLAANHPDAALPVLQKAADIAPQDASVLLHLGRALTKAGQTSAAAGVFARYRKLDVRAGNPLHGGGLVEFLSLPPGEQQARYRTGVERTVAAQPDNVEAQVKYLELLLEDGKRQQAREVCRTILNLKPSGELLAEGGRALLEAEEYATAEEFLKKGMAAAGSLPELQSELAQARFYSAGPQAGLAERREF
ncbi:MAG: hypothetical protein JWP08_3548 [Bryobacterales bacterium]|nr:hypothetical protein [Bryobacterales bacterium]